MRVYRPVSTVLAGFAVGAALTCATATAAPLPLEPFVAEPAAQGVAEPGSGSSATGSADTLFALLRGPGWCGSYVLC